MTTATGKRRNAELITPPNLLKAKVGTGGLPMSILVKAQDVIDKQTGDDFPNFAQRHLGAFQEGLRLCETRRADLDSETLLSTLIHPVMQIKANGAMFNYAGLSELAAHCISILEIVDDVQPDLIELMDGYHTVMRAFILGHLTKDGGKDGQDMVAALYVACDRFLQKYGMSL